MNRERCFFLFFLLSRQRKPEGKETRYRDLCCADLPHMANSGVCTPENGNDV
ncbi:hypothetical protein CSUI_004791 [Cystoisospora suis]|uniref:Uncharacterized protein n=1 Tax=Cystoisospora suis TaxID=483139 RepID=A0A2C6KLJ8_9APIC|nr:hypothetical protein CSUI_004791 [Cystoisospora suis]